jgi:hypothetical protein
MTGRRIAGISLVVLAAACALMPMPASGVERVYATGLYPLLQRVITPASNLLPFALLDLLVLAALILVGRMLLRATRRWRLTRDPAPFLSAAGHLAAGAAALYLAFLVLWGFNYRRIPMAERLDVTGEAVTADAVASLGLEAVSRMNQLHQASHGQGWNDEVWRDEPLRASFASTQPLLSSAPLAVPGRLKQSVFGLYFRWAGIDGMVHPFALEVIGNPDLLPWERPFVAAHEWAHLAGYAHEAEANFVGWLTCVRGNVPAQYSGWLYLYWQIAGEVSPKDRARLEAALEPGPKRDIEAIAERLRAGQLPFLRTVSWTMYDHYLRANRVETGLRSYGEVVNLIIRARFDDGWAPLRKGEHYQSRR